MQGGHVERSRSAWPHPFWSLLPAAAAALFAAVALPGTPPMEVALHALAASGAWWIGRALQVDYGNALITGLLFATSPLAQAALSPQTAPPYASPLLLPLGVALWARLRNPETLTGEPAARRRIAAVAISVGLTAGALVLVLAARRLGAPFPSSTVHIGALGPALLAGQLLAALARPGKLRPLRAALASTVTVMAMAGSVLLMQLR